MKKIERYKWYTREIEPPPYDDILIDIGDRMLVGYYRPNEKKFYCTQDNMEYTACVMRWRLLPK